MTSFIYIKKKIELISVLFNSIFNFKIKRYFIIFVIIIGFIDICIENNSVELKIKNRYLSIIEYLFIQLLVVC